MLKLWRANECRGAPSAEVCTEMKNVEIIYNMNGAKLVGNMSPMGASREGPEREGRKGENKIRGGTWCIF